MREIEREIVGIFLISSDDYLLLGRGGVYKDSFIVPGGGIESGETKLEALKRETLEETGIDISTLDIQEIDFIHYGRSEKKLRHTGEMVIVKMIFHDFLVKSHLRSDLMKLNCTDDFVDAMWQPLSELSEPPLSPPAIVSLKRLGYITQK